MNIAVILNFFEYFLNFPSDGGEHRYFFVTAREKFAGTRITNLEFCDWEKSAIRSGQSPKGDVNDMFAIARRLRSIPPGADLGAIACVYERFFEEFLLRRQINLLVGGATTGFERCGLATAKRLGVGTMYVWEGFFRPDTISVDPQGMNAESAFRKLPFEAIRTHQPTAGSGASIDRFIERGQQGVHRPTLDEIHGEKFDVFRQARNRFSERRDLERIRLPFTQHMAARMSYYRALRNYERLEHVHKPFLFFPLQMHTDSNVVLNTPLFPYGTLVSTVLDSFRKARHDLQCDLVIKEHPLDVFRIHYDRKREQGIHWLAPEIPVPQILNDPQCCGTVVANSTAGFESLLAGKPVLTLGNSLYSYPELVEIPKNPKDDDSIMQSIKNLPNRAVNADLTKKFASCLYDKTQMRGNLEKIPGREEVASFEKLWKVWQ
ncbi:MAG: hypothetical protein WBD36_14610 [Bacteroidota bacterium]